MMYILDIETIPDVRLQETFNNFVKRPKKEAENDNWERKKMSVDPDYANIACIGIKALNGEKVILQLEDMEDWFKSRTTVVVEEVEKTYYNFEFVTFNGKAFDIPLLIKQGLKNKLNFPYKHLQAMTNKWRNNHHYDLMDAIGTFGQYKSLDHYLGIYLGEKKETAGDDFFATATRAQLEDHCLQDLDYTEKLYKIFKPIL